MKKEKVSKCCNAPVAISGTVKRTGGIDYFYKCLLCNKRCKLKKNENKKNKMKIRVSTCCNCKVAVSGRGDFHDKDEDGTFFYYCLSCQKPCDTKLVEKKSTMEVISNNPPNKK